MCCVLSCRGRIVEQRTDDDFVLFNTLKHLVLQQHLVSRDLLALRAETRPDGLVATVTAPASEPEIKVEPSLLPAETAFRCSDPEIEHSECFKTIGHRIRVPSSVNHGVSSLLPEKSESGEMVAVVEAVMKRAMGGLLEGLQAVQCAVTDLCEARNADRRALEAAVTASTASTAAASAGESGALREVIWHYKHILDKRSELDLLISHLQVASHSHNAVQGSSRQKVPCQWVSAADGVEAAMPEISKNLKIAEAPATGVGGVRLCLEKPAAGLPISGVSLSSGPARQSAASLAVAAIAPAVNSTTSSLHGLGQGTRRRGGKAALANQDMSHSNALPLSGAVEKSSDQALKMQTARGDRRISGSVSSVVNESSAKQMQQKKLELATGRDGIRWKQRFGRHQAEVVTSFSKASLTHTGSFPHVFDTGGGSIYSLATGGAELLTAAGTCPDFSGYGRSIMEKPMLPAAGSEVVWTSRPGTLINSNS